MTAKRARCPLPSRFRDRDPCFLHCSSSGNNAKVNLIAGRHTVRVCVMVGGFTLDEITFEEAEAPDNDVCNSDGT